MSVQCCPKSIKTALNRIFSCALLSGASRSLEVKILCKVVPGVLRQLCRIFLPAQCCSKTSETTLHKKTTSAILAKNAQACFRRKSDCSLECLVACILTGCSITEQSWLFLFNVGSRVHLQLVGKQ